MRTLWPLAVLALGLSSIISAQDGHLPAEDGALPVREVPRRPLDTILASDIQNGARGQTLPMAPARSIAIDVREGTWLSPDISPDGRTIVFELLGDLYTIDSIGGDARPIATGMAFQSQPVFSPDGDSIVYISDFSGAENIWIARSDGSEHRQVTFYDGNAVFTSPAWSNDGQSIFVSRYRADRVAFELWQIAAETGEAELVAPIKTTAEQPRDQWQSTLGAFPSADGRFLYYARHIGESDGGQVPEWTIERLNLASGEEETLVSAPRSPRPDLALGTAFRPAVSPDGRLLAYGVRDRGRTGLRLLDLESRESRWLAYPVQHDQLQATPWRDVLPRHVFTPDGKALIVNSGGRIATITIDDGVVKEIPFHVRSEIEIGPSTRQEIHLDKGPVQARLIQHPAPSPDGTQLAFSTLGSIYVMPLTEGAIPRRLGHGFQPSWSPDGDKLVYVRWTASEAGSVWTTDLATGAVRKLTETRAFYSNPVFTPDGQTVVAIRSSNDDRIHAYMEFGTTRQADLVAIDLQDGRTRSLVQGAIGGTPHFGPDKSEVLLNFVDGVYGIPLAGGEARKIVGVTGPGWYFAEGRAPADDIRISPRGEEALVQIAQQLYLIRLPDTGESVDLADPLLSSRKLTDVGADFIVWSDGGETIGWAVGSTWFRHARAGIDLQPGSAQAAPPITGEAFDAVIELPRAIIASGSIVLRGATAITMKGNERIADADVVVTDGRIVGIGSRGSVVIPADATIRDVSGKWITPGFIETHDHIADVRRQVLDFQSWGPLANLAYGVTTAFDPSTLTIDMLAYQDAVEAGLMIGSRIPSTGPAIFSFNDFQSYDEIEAVLRRYRDHYRLRNIKMYRSGNRRVRQWIAQAAREVGLHPTAEGALAMKLGLTQIIDGYAANEHALTAAPLRDDVLTLMAESGVGYTTTLMIGNGGPEGQDYFIVRDKPGDDPKLNRFAPRQIVDMKMRDRTYRPLEDFFFSHVAQGAARLARRDGLVGMGSHGEVPGLGFHWEMEAHALGGMTPEEVLRAATIDAARVIGHEADLGSLEVGKVADLVILDRDPLHDIRNTRTIVAVMQAGRLRDGETMDEIWPEQRPLARRWYCDDRPPGSPDPCRQSSD